MKNTLFNPKKLELPRHLVLVPQFWDKAYYEKLKKDAMGCLDFMSSDLLLFQDYTVVVGFLGYPHILTLLEFIDDVRGKEIYFLGTAGSLNERIDRPIPLNTVEICSTAILDHFAGETSYSLKTFERGNLQTARGVTVDIIQRETPEWLKEQVKRGIDFVEMELFPLRVYLEKPFYAIVVTSDLLKETGIEVFKDRETLQKEFVNSYQLIVSTIANSN
jgi:hypothetical protein